MPFSSWGTAPIVSFVILLGKADAKTLHAHSNLVLPGACATHAGKIQRASQQLALLQARQQHAQPCISTC